MEQGIADESRSTKASMNLSGSNWKDEAIRSSSEWKVKAIRESTIRNTATLDNMKQEQLLAKRGTFVSRNTMNQITTKSGIVRLSTAMGFKRASRISAYDIGEDQAENEEILEDIWDSLNRIDMDINVSKPFIIPHISNIIACIIIKTSVAQTALVSCAVL